ncbi:MAG: phosphopantothenoylcysteine decarboxylase [Planctomycetes bacterium]|nr:phosphopantothenoylcysteine decarboxylase [Planctomycetota bacterium]
MRLLVTAGPTREYIDTVRFLSNASSGKMGFAVATNAASRGHDVILIAGPVDLPDPENVDVVRVVSTADMYTAAVAAFETCDAAVMAAAPCDFRPRTVQPLKLAKTGADFHLDLEKTIDICAELGKVKGNRVVIGFAMEDHDHKAHAEEKLARKRCDAIVLNSVDTLAADTATIEIFRPAVGWSDPISGRKSDLASAIIDLIEETQGLRSASRQ